MKKTLILLVAMAFAAAGASAQFRVLKNGQARFGKEPSSLAPFGVASEGGTIQPPVTIDKGDTLACAVFSNDSVKAGGSMKVSASEVTFEGGFSVEKGGILSVSAQKEKL